MNIFGGIFIMSEGNEDLTFNEILEILHDQIVFISDRIKNGRIKDVKNEEIKIKWIRTLAYICKTHANIRQAEKLDELEEEVKKLKERLNIGD